ncbi:hypothetical protein M409DRAFT_26789 [Zasmidium cellare ATCC 36951]|uniref:J domain-containing protein n=1 Tax=Zasmidium cellare ATCC 36951 TaxID=1080233 RepID=A0A6A6CBV7_ZASCE|nr:uncharacterized protein M409DRAFT_26789 [Zasmidium cellare ATCC 36951]KAF2162936.1 hypothetical protein M409DRAFT_26789 [Zasmidium cellare ATCC 36951]
MADMDIDNWGLSTPSQAIGPGHYGTLGVHQSASNRAIMKAYDALEARAIQELTYDEPTAQQEAAKEAPLEQLRSAARILNDSRTRRLYDRELRGEKVDWDHWAAKARDAYRGYRDLDTRSYVDAIYQTHPTSPTRTDLLTVLSQPASLRATYPTRPRATDLLIIQLVAAQYDLDRWNALMEDLYLQMKLQDVKGL